jgi:hypothetical protein
MVEGPSAFERVPNHKTSKTKIPSGEQVGGFWCCPPISYWQLDPPRAVASRGGLFVFPNHSIRPPKMEV